MVHVPSWETGVRDTENYLSSVGGLTFAVIDKIRALVAWLCRIRIDGCDLRITPLQSFIESGSRKQGLPDGSLPFCLENSSPGLLCKFSPANLKR